MKQLVVADGSPLISLLNIGHLDWLEKMFSHIVIPPMVVIEVERGETEDSVWFALKESDFIRTTNLQADKRLQILLLQVDPGESEAIILADQLDLPLLIDDKAGRKMAQTMGLKITGLVGVLEALKRKEEISTSQMPKVLEELEAAEFRLSSALKQRLLE